MDEFDPLPAPVQVKTSLDEMRNAMKWLNIAKK
jgi:hypothetical protein